MTQLGSCPGPDLLLLLEHQLLEDDAELRQHLAECPECRAGRELLGAGLQAPPLPFAPDELLPQLREALTARAPSAEELAGAPSADVHLLCTYCKDRLESDEGVYCAQCLAPHHGDCFAEHGHCAAGGCKAREVVRSGPVVARPRPRWRRRLLWGFGLVLAGGSLAALTEQGRILRQEAELARAAAAEAVLAARRARAAQETSDSAEPAAHVSRRYALNGLLAAFAASQVTRDDAGGEPEWVRAYRQALAERQVSLNFPATPLDEVVRFLQETTGLNIVLGPAVDPTREVSLRLTNIRLGDALTLILEQVQLEMRLANETLCIDQLRRADPEHPGSWPIGPAPPADTGEGARARLADHVHEAVRSAHGDGAWEPPASLSFSAGELVVIQTAAAHVTIRTALDALRRPALPEALRTAWFFPALAPAEDPAGLRARELARRLESQRVTLNFDETPFAEALSFVQDISGVPLRVDPAVLRQVEREQLRVSLRLKAIPLRYALTFIVSAHEQLEWDVDRRGILIRRRATKPLEERLEELGARALAPERLATLDRLRGASLSVDFEARPLEELFAAVREATGLEVGYATALDQEAPISLACVERPVGEVLDAVLTPLNLDFEVGGDSLRVKALQGGPVHGLSWAKREARRAELLERAAPGPAGLGLGLEILAQRLAEATELDVHWGPRLRSSRARLALPPQASVGELLELARVETGLRHAIVFPSLAEEPVLALERVDPDPLVRALQTVQRDSSWREAPPPASEALSTRRAALLDALVGLAGVRVDELTPPGRLAETLASIEGARAGLEELLEGHAQLSFPEGPRAWAEGRERLRQLAVNLLGQHDAKRKEILTARRSAEHTREQLEYGLAQLRVELRACEEYLAQRGAQAVGEERAEERRNAETERRRLREQRKELLNRMALRRRDAALAEARLASEQAQLASRLSELAWFPALERSRDEKRRLLAEGQAWEQVFPEGVRTWWEGTHTAARAAQELGLRRLSFLGLLVEGEELRGAEEPRPVLLAGTRRGSLAQLARLGKGDLLVSAGGQPLDGAFELLEALGNPEPGQLLLERERLGKRRTLSLPLERVPSERRGVLPVSVRAGEDGLRVVEEGEGLRPGDRIEAVAALRVSTLVELEQVLDCFAVGARVQVRLERDGDGLEFEVPLVDGLGDLSPESESESETEPEPESESQTEAESVGEVLRARRERIASIASEGGSAGTDVAVQAALRWLARHQQPDGRWSSADWGAQCGGEACSGPGQARGDARYDVGVTSLALLAYLGRGHTDRHGDFPDVVHRGLAWLMAQPGETGGLGFSHGETIYNHAFATQALCEAFALTGDPDQGRAARQAFTQCLAAQNPLLGWKYGVRTGRNDTCVTGAMVEALAAARTSGFALPTRATEGALRWLVRSTNDAGEVGYETPGGGSSFLVPNDGRFDMFPSMTAVGLHAQRLLGVTAREDRLRRGARLLRQHLPRWPRSGVKTINFYYWLRGTQAMFHMGGRAWKDWNRAMQDALLPQQRMGGCADGSWNPVGEWCLVGGRVYATAINALTLETYYRHPRAP